MTANSAWSAIVIARLLFAAPMAIRAPSNAAESTQTDDPMRDMLVPKVQQAILFLTKKRACHVAFSTVINDRVPGTVYCVWDGVANAGSINEFAGCFLGRYSLAHDNYLPVADYAALMGRNQPKGKCTKKVVGDILTKYAGEDWFQVGKEPRPILVAMRQDDKSVRVLYDEWKLITPTLLEAADTWKSQPSAVDTSKQCFNDFTCDGGVCVQPNDYQAGHCAPKPAQ